MLKQAVASFKFSHFSLLCIGLMWVWPFLYYVHALPLTTFYQEWSAVLLGLCAMPLLLAKRHWERPEVPRIILLPLGLMVLVLVQFALGKMEYVSQALLVALYLLWAALLVMLGRCLREELGLPLLATVLAFFLLVGAELSTVIGLIQHFRWHTFLDHVVLVNLTGVFGNMGQPNHFADYISLGLASLGLLYVRWNLRGWKVVLLALPMLYVLMLCESRSPWLYLLSFSAMAYFWQRKDETLRRLLHYCLLLLLGFFLMQFTVYIPWLSGGHVPQTFFNRLDSAHGGVIRRWIWYEAGLMFAAHPFLGVGFGQFAWEHFLLGPELRNPMINGLYNNAHNIVMQTAAEMGAAGVLLFAGMLGLWIRQAYRASRSIYHWWGFGVLAVLGIHSLLEYPLWYTYFLGIAALMLGVLDGTTHRLESGRIGRVSLAAILLLGVLSLIQVWQGYRMLETLARPQPEGVSRGEYASRLMEAHRQFLMQPYVEAMLSNISEGQTGRLELVRTVNESVMHFAPIASFVYREVYLLGLSGEQEAAKLQLERAIWAYPAGCPPFIEKLREGAQKDPVHFSALVEFAQIKYEEYLVAARGGL